MSQESFRADETIANGVRRVALSELEAAMALLRDPELDHHEAVHEARKKIKRLRALLRLARKPLGASYRRENQALRDTARSLTQVREAAAALEALERLRQSHGERVASERFQAVHGELARHAPEDRESIAELMHAAVGELRGVRERLAALPLSGDGFETVASGFRENYRRARSALGHASRHLTAEAFHELRKAVKTHQHQLQLFEAVWPELLKARRRELAELAELLGEHHDLSLLVPDLSARGYHDVAAAGEERSAEVELLILQRARRLFAERPRHLTGSLGDWYAAYREAPLSPLDAR